MKHLKTYENVVPEKKIVYTLETKAISKTKEWEEKTYQHIVDIRTSWAEPNPTKVGELVLNIQGTPASWYISTLLEGIEKRKKGLYQDFYNKISIDGDWMCINYNDIMNELISILPDLEIYVSQNKYNV
jgi:hypothetical protein